MALTNNNLEIIKAIAKNDIHVARIAAMASLAEDTSKKNRPYGVSKKPYMKYKVVSNIKAKDI